MELFKYAAKGDMPTCVSLLQNSQADINHEDTVSLLDFAFYQYFPYCVPAS